MTSPPWRPRRACVPRPPHPGRGRISPQHWAGQQRLMAKLAAAAGGLLAAVSELPGKIIQNGLIIWTFVLIGIYLVLARYLFMEFAPWGARHAKLTADFVNILMDIIWAMFEAIRVVIAAIVALVRFIEGKPKKHFTVQSPPHKISAEQMRHFLLTVPVECHDFTWASTELLVWPLRRLLSPSVCPVLRYLWPVPALFGMADPVLGWLSEDPTPVTGGNNCKEPPGTDWICVGFGAGYLVLEIIVPLLIFLLIAWPLILVLMKESSVVIGVALGAAHKVVGVVERALLTIGAGIERVLSVN